MEKRHECLDVKFDRIKLSNHTKEQLIREFFILMQSHAIKECKIFEKRGVVFKT
jgi:hypothetical protein